MLPALPVPEGVTLWLSERQGQAGPYVKLDMIRVPAESQRQGIGTRVMSDLCAWADREDVTLTLDPGDDFGTPKTFLRRWYRHFGFIPNRGRRADLSLSGIMVRYPTQPKE